MADFVFSVAAAGFDDTPNQQGLTSLANAALAPLLTNLIRGVSFLAEDQERLLGNELKLTVSYDDAGVATLTDPYEIQGFAATSLAALNTAMQAFITLNPTLFISGAYTQVLHSVVRKNRYIGLLFTCADAAGGASNWALIDSGSGGSVPVGPAGGDLSGTYPNPTVRQSSVAFGLTADITPTTLAASQNNYTPTGLAGANTIRLSASTPVNITGLTGGADGRIIVLTNVSGSAITLTNQDAASTAANRFFLATDLTLPQGASVIVQYDATLSRWTAVSGPTSGALPPSGAAGGDLSGTYPNPTVKQSSVAFALDGTLTPAVIGSDQNDYNPASLSGANTLRLASSATVSITGLAGGATGRILAVTNVGSNTITLTNQDAASTAANRFNFAADQMLAPAASILLQYDATLSRWNSVAVSSIETDIILTGTLASGANVVDSLSLATIGDACWEIELVKTTTRYASTIRANHNGTTPNFLESGVVLSPPAGTFDFVTDVDASGGNMRLTINASTTGWDYRIRRRTLPA